MLWDWQNFCFSHLILNTPNSTAIPTWAPIQDQQRRMPPPETSWVFLGTLPFNHCSDMTLPICWFLITQLRRLIVYGLIIVLVFSNSNKVLPSTNVWDNTNKNSTCISNTIVVCTIENPKTDQDGKLTIVLSTSKLLWSSSAIYTEYAYKNFHVLISQRHYIMNCKSKTWPFPLHVKLDTLVRGPHIQ